MANNNKSSLGPEDATRQSKHDSWRPSPNHTPTRNASLWDAPHRAGTGSQNRHHDLRQEANSRSAINASSTNASSGYPRFRGASSMSPDPINAGPMNRKKRRADEMDGTSQVHMSRIGLDSKRQRTSDSYKADTTAIDQHRPERSRTLIWATGNSSRRYSAKLTKANFHRGDIIHVPHFCAALDANVRPGGGRSCFDTNLGPVCCKKRYMVVVLVSSKSMVCMPLTTFGDRGLRSKMGDPEEHREYVGIRMADNHYFDNNGAHRELVIETSEDEIKEASAIHLVAPHTVFFQERITRKGRITTASYDHLLKLVVDFLLHGEVKVPPALMSELQSINPTSEECGSFNGAKARSSEDGAKIASLQEQDKNKENKNENKVHPRVEGDNER